MVFFFGFFLTIPYLSGYLNGHFEFYNPTQSDYLLSKRYIFLLAFQDMKAVFMITWFKNGEFATRIPRTRAVGFLHVKCSLIKMSVRLPIHKEERDVFVFCISSSWRNLSLSLESFFSRQGKIFIGVNCDTNDAKVAKLSSAISGGKRTYKCYCEGTLATGEPTMYCYMHNWECQI